MAAGVYPQVPRLPESAGFLRQMLILVDEPRSSQKNMTVDWDH